MVAAAIAAAGRRRNQRPAGAADLVDDSESQIAEAYVRGSSLVPYAAAGAYDAKAMANLAAQDRVSNRAARQQRAEEAHWNLERGPAGLARGLAASHSDMFARDRLRRKLMERA